MKIKEIYVEDLFGLYTYSIPFNKNEKIKIIHAPNGCGKTTILKLIDDIINCRLFQIRQVPFSSFKIKFDNDIGIEVLKVNKSIAIKDEETYNEPFISYKISKDGKTKEYKITNKVNGDEGIERKIQPVYIERKLPFLTRIAAREWIDNRTDEKITYDEVLNNYSELLFVNNEMRIVLNGIVKEMQIHFIKANRLTRRNTLKDNSARYSNSLASVLAYSKELVEKIESTLAESSTVTQELDRTFPARLIEMMTYSNHKQIINIDKELEELEKRRIRLEEVGLLTATNSEEVEATNQIDEATSKVLSLYIEDTKKKLNIFNSLEGKINLMKDIINKRFNNKIMKIDKSQGITFELPDKNLLTPEKLSSGEQNELVLIYELLFKSEANSLILIDEPEISLHISWQQQFVEDILKIANLTGVNILIATHSPDIINGRWDLTTGLGEE